jgi:cystathionine gamma-lyase
MGDHFGDSTRSLHSGVPQGVPGAPVVPAPVISTVHHLRPEGYQPGDDYYVRADNPSRRELEAAIGELEGGECLTFASGQAAVTAALLSVLRPGDTVMIPSDGYFSVRGFAASTLAELKINTIETPTAGPYPGFEGVRLVLLETPANPGLDLVDIAAVADRAHLAGALVAVDNTTATPLGQRPLDLGADLVVASGTKALTGHSDILLGYTVTRSQQLQAGLRGWRTSTGSTPSPFDCWLARRSMSTLALRLRQQSTNAAQLSAVLRAHPLAQGVRWTGDSPLAARQMSIIPGIVSFQLPSEEHVTAFLRALKLVAVSTSFGGLHSSADRRLQWGDNVPAGFIRFSCGIEDTADLIADVTAALDAAGVEAD